MYCSFCCSSHVLLKMSASVVGKGQSPVLLVSAVCAVTCCARGAYSACSSLMVVILFSSSCWGLQLHVVVLTVAYNSLCGGGLVTMWCPVFLQTEDKVGVSALTESWTHFRPYTDHTTNTYKHLT